MSQARTWLSLCLYAGHCTHAGGPLCGSAPRRSALPSAPAHCGRLARLWGTFVLPPHVRSFMPPWLALFPALPYLPSALRPARVQCGAIRVAPLPLCSLSLPWPLGPVLPPVCSPSSSSCAPLPRSLGPWLSVSLSPSSLYPLGKQFAEQHARHPSHSPFTLPLPGALVPSAPARSLRPSSPALPPPPSPALFPLYTYIFTLRMTLCMQVAGTSQARTRPLPPRPALSPLSFTLNTSQDTV